MVTYSKLNIFYSQKKSLVTSKLVNINLYIKFHTANSIL